MAVTGTYTIIPDLTKLQAELDKVAAREAAVAKAAEQLGVSTAKASKALTAVEAAAKRAAKGPSEWTLALQANTAAVQAAQKELGAFRGDINLASESLGKIGSAVGEVNEDMGELIGYVQKAAGVVSGSIGGWQVLGGVMTGVLEVAAPLGLVLAPLAAAYLDLANAAEAAAAATEVYNKAQEDALPLADRALSAVKELKLETSGLNELEKQQAKIQQSYIDQLAIANAATEKELELAREKLAGMAKTNSAYITTYDAVKNLEQQLRTNIDLARDGNAAEQLLAEYKYETAAATDAVTKATKDSTQATKDHLAALKEEADFLAGVSAQLEGWHPIDGLTGLSKEDMFAEVETFEAAQVRLAIAAGKRAQIAIDLEDSIRAAQKRTNEQARAGAEDLIGTFSDAAGAIADATADSGGQAAQSAFLASQALGYTQAAIAALKTGGEVAAQLAPVLGPAAIPVGVAAGVAAGAAFAAPIAAMQPPAFDDSPGVMQVGPSGRQDVNLKEGDLWLAAQSMDGLTAQMGAYLSAQQGIQSRRPRRSRLRDRLALNPLQVLGIDLPRAIRGGGR